MSIRTLVIVGVLWCGSLLGVGVLAQSREYRSIPEPRVLTGGDLGFRVDGMYGEVPTGTVVVRVNGQWVEAMVGKPGIGK